jgi:hypothetical protein
MRVQTDLRRLRAARELIDVDLRASADIVMACTPSSREMR